MIELSTSPDPAVNAASAPGAALWQALQPRTRAELGNSISAWHLQGAAPATMLRSVFVLCNGDLLEAMVHGGGMSGQAMCSTEGMLETGRVTLGAGASPLACVCIILAWQAIGRLMGLCKGANDMLQ